MLPSKNTWVLARAGFLERFAADADGVLADAADDLVALVAAEADLRIKDHVGRVDGDKPNLNKSSF